MINNKKKILLVEDNALILMNQKLQLEKYGYDLVTTFSGENSIELIKKNGDIDLILMDINLGGGIDGTKAAEIILKEKDIPIIFLSSHTEPEIVENTEKITSYGYVTKDAGITVLDASIKMAFKLYETKKKEEIININYQNLFNSIQDAILVTDRNRNIINCNPAFTALFGYELHELKGKQTEILCTNKDDFSHVGDLLKKHINTGNNLNFIIQYRKKTGEDFTGETRLFLIHDNSGGITGYVSLTRDITEEKLAENLIQKSESHANTFENLRKQALEMINADNRDLRASSGVILEAIHELEIHQEELIVQNKELQNAEEKISLLNKELTETYEMTPCGIILLDSKMFIIKINSTAADILGNTKTKIMGKDFLSFISKESKNLFLDILRTSTATRSRISSSMNIQNDKNKTNNIELSIFADCNKSGNVKYWHIAFILKSGEMNEKK